MDILQAARQLRPGTAWILTTFQDGTQHLEQAEDEAPRVEIPTMDELQAVVDAVAYRDKRAAEYPTIGDQLDALWKGGDAAQAMLQQIQDVKAKHPKP